MNSCKDCTHYRSYEMDWYNENGDDLSGYVVSCKKYGFELEIFISEEKANNYKTEPCKDFEKVEEA
jgi:hypothetical protein